MTSFTPTYHYSSGAAVLSSSRRRRTFQGASGHDPCHIGTLAVWRISNSARTSTLGFASLARFFKLEKLRIVQELDGKTFWVVLEMGLNEVR